MFRSVYLPGDRAFIRFTEIPANNPPLLWLHGMMCSSTGELMPAAVQPELRARRHGVAQPPALEGVDQLGRPVGRTDRTASLAEA